jgi:hypothetical protein
MFDIRSLALVALLAVPIAATTSGCYVDAEGPEASYGYEPQYYNGRIVYYDTAGRPFYYEGGGQIWIAATDPYYGGYVTHWRTYGPAYNAWYTNHGYRYHTWRGNSGYYGGHAGYRVYRGGGATYRGGRRR